MLQRIILITLIFILYCTNFLHAMEQQVNEINHLNVLPSELLVHIADQLFNYRSISEATQSFRELNVSCKKNCTILTDSVQHTIETVSARYSISLMLAAAYLGTEATKKWFENEKKYPITPILTEMKKCSGLLTIQDILQRQKMQPD